MLTLFVIVLGLLGAASFSVYHHIPIPVEPTNVTVAMTPASAANDSQDNWQLYNFTHPSFISDGELAYEAEIVSSACATESNLTSCSTLMNSGLCGITDVIVSEKFLSHFATVHSLIYPFCLLVVILLYSLIYRAVLVQRARRRSMRSLSAALAKPVTSPPPLANPAPGITPTDATMEPIIMTCF